MKSYTCPRWQPEEDTRLHDLFEIQGLSARDCAQQMHRSRNSIIGRVHRLKLRHLMPTAHTSSYPRCAWPRKERRRKPKQQEIGTVVARKHVLRRTQCKNVFIWETGELTETQWESLGPSIMLAELERHHCRWPTITETGETVYCGIQKVDGASYCSFHCSIAYQRSPMRISDEERMRHALNARKNAKEYWINKGREAA